MRFFFTALLASCMLLSCRQNSLEDDSSKYSLLSFLDLPSRQQALTVSIDQAAGQPDPTNAAPIVFSVVFSEAVDPATFTSGDITQNGTAGVSAWALSTGDNIAWTLEAATITSPGTVVPGIAAGAVQDPLGNGNTASTSTDNIVTFDTAGPSVVVNQAVGQQDPTNAVPISFTIVFNEAINAATFDASDIVQSGTAPGVTWNLLPSGDNITWTLQASVVSGIGTVVPTIGAGAVQDAAGNSNTASTSADNSVDYDLTPPTVTVNRASGQPNPTNSTPILFAAVFNEAINSGTFTPADITQNGTASVTTWRLSTMDNITWTLEATGVSTGTVVPSIAASTVQDVAGNYNTTASTSTDNSVDYDSTNPAVTINQAVSQLDPTNTTPVVFTVVFSKAINPATFTPTDIMETGSTATGITWNLANSGDDINWTLSATAVTGPGTLVPSIPAGAAQDAYGNGNAASASTDNSVMFDNVAPAIAAFTMPSTTDWKTIAVNITASDNVGVTGWMITESSAPPAAGDPGWLTANPTCYTLSGTYGVYELYAWVKDGSGNVNASGSSTHFPRTYSIPPYTARPMQTGQTGCYNAAGATIACAGTGQDGELQRGLMWPVPRFTNNGLTLTDNLTGLIWVADANHMSSSPYSAFDTDAPAGNGAVYWETALNYAKQLNTDSYAGRTDWRIPNIVELVSFMDYGESSMSSWLASFGIGNLVSLPYWSSTTYHDTTATQQSAWTFNLATGRRNNSDDKDGVMYYAWAVAGTSAILPKTGQTLCYNTTTGAITACTGMGQDGDSQMGVAWPSPRFTDNLDGTMTDNLTGLMWMQDANIMASQDPGFDGDGTIGDGLVTWQHALDYVIALNSYNSGAGYLGHNDWRLPNYHELQWMKNYGANYSWLGASGFANAGTTFQLFWTSTTRELLRTTAFEVNAPYGISNSMSKTNNYGAWPVRGGN